MSAQVCAAVVQAAIFLRHLSSGVLNELSGLRGATRGAPTRRTPQVSSHIDDYNGRGQYATGMRTEPCARDAPPGSRPGSWCSDGALAGAPLRGSGATDSCCTSQRRYGWRQWMHVADLSQIRAQG